MALFITCHLLTKPSLFCELNISNKYMKVLIVFFFFRFVFRPFTKFRTGWGVLILIQMILFSSVAILHLLQFFASLFVT